MDIDLGTLKHILRGLCLSFAQLESPSLDSSKSRIRLSDSICFLIGARELQLILEETYKNAQGITQDVGGSLYTKSYIRANEIVKQRGKITRRQLIQRLSPSGVSADLILKIMQHVHQEGLVKITLRGEKKNYPSTIGEELYTWDK